MYKKMFEVECTEKTVEAVNAAFLAATGDDDWGYDTMEDIEKAEREGFLEFKNGIMTVFMDGE